MQNTKSLLSLAVACCMLLTLPACGSKKKLDKTVKQLRTAAESDDYEAFGQLVHPSLLDKFPEKDLTRLSKALEKLGTFKERTMKGISVVAGGKREGNYKLRYEEGSVELKIALVSGKIISFNFGGEDLAEALKAMRAARYAKFEVGQFNFLIKPGGEDKRSNNIFKVGQHVAFRMLIHGLKQVDKTIHFDSDLKVTANDKLILSKPNFAGSDKPISIKGLAVGTLSGTIRLPKVPATYIAHFKIKDHHAKRTLDYKQAVVVQP